MIKQLAISATKYFVSRNWIDATQSEWCQYAIEKQLGKILICTICLIFMALTHTWNKVLPFVVVFNLFRERMGGWHAKHFWSCQAMSTGLVVLITFIIGPFMECMYLPMQIALDILAVTITYFASPVYPIEAHFTQAVKHSNSKRKNQMLLILVVLQGMTMSFFGVIFLVYSLLALLFTDLSVLLQYFKLQKGRMIQS